MPIEFRVVCISRDVGAGGETVGRGVADGLGFRYVDEEIVTGAAKKLGVDVDLVADAESRRSLTRKVVEEVMADMGHAGMLTGAAPPRQPTTASEDYRALIQQTIFETAEQGEVVIVAHAASVALGGTRNVMRVLVTASPQNRIERAALDLGVTAAEAKKLVNEGDRARADYLKRFYGVKRELSTHYDLVINTDAIAVEEASRLVLTACGAAPPTGA
jgi:cytidylate kinase